jgi:hypothetical protein
MNRIGLLSAVAAMVCAQSAHAACWSAEDVRAAKVRDLQTLLMVVGERCTGAGFGGSGDYAAFDRQRGGIAASAQRLKARFWTLHGPADGSRLLDGFDKTLARQYARVPIVAENCGQVQALAGEAAGAAGSMLALAELADQHSFTPPLAGGVCGVSLARR